MRTLFFLMISACVSNQQTLQVDDTRVTLQADPFLLRVSRAGQVVAEANAVLGIADRPEYFSQFLPGWDGYIAHETPTTLGQARMVRGGTHPRLVFTSGGREVGSVSVQLAPERVQIDVQSVGFEKTALAFRAGADEHFFGLGERFASVDHRGLSLYSWAEEGGLGTGEKSPAARGSAPLPNGASMTYFPVPFVHSTAGYSLFANTTYRTELRMASEVAEQLVVVAETDRLPLFIYTAPTPLARLSRYTEDTGRPMVPAPWVWGVRMRASAFDTVDGEQVYARMRARKLPVTAFDDTVHFLPNNSHVGREQQLLAGTELLHRWGFKVVAYNTPYVATMSSDYQFGVDHGLFQKTPTGEPATTFFISGAPLTLSPIDLINPEGFAWYQQLLNRTVDLGYDGWMNDFGEYTARTSLMADGRSGKEVHNLYPVLSARAAHEVLEARKPNDYWFFVRSGYVGTQQWVSQVWGGDSEASFDDTQGLPSAVRAGLNLAMVGVSQYGSDTTGFKCTTGDAYDKEIYIRWLQFAAVSPLFHEENGCANPLADVSKWKLWNDDETQEAWRQTASLHTRMAPYLRALAVKANASGIPVMLHPFMSHPEERDGWGVEDSYFFGPSLYAAPVVRRGQSERRVWLPPGRYVEWTERTVHQGPGFVTVPAPLMRLPLFLVENTLLPLLDAEVQTLAPSLEPSVVTEDDRRNVLDVVAVLGAGGTAEFTLVDGATIRLVRDQTDSAPGAGAKTSRTTMQQSGREGDISVTITGGPMRDYRFEIIRI